MTIRSVFVFSLVLLACAAGLAAQAAPAAKDASKGWGKLNVGVIDLNAISEKYEKHKDDIEKLRAEADAIETEFSKLVEKMKGLEERRQLFDENSEEYDNYTMQIEEIKLKLQVMKNTVTKKIEKKQIDLVKSLYADVREAVKEFAEQNGYDLIMVQMGDDLMGRKLQDVVLEIQMKPVIFSSPSMDITDKIVDFLNTRYRAQLEKKDGMKDQIR